MTICTQPLVGLGYPCGRPGDPASPSGRCTFHSEASGERRGRSARKPVGAVDNVDDDEEKMLRPGVVAKPGCALCSCGCGDPVYSRGMGYACYHVEYRRIRKARRQMRAQRETAVQA